MRTRKKQILLIMIIAIAMVMATAICVFAASVKDATGYVNTPGDVLMMRKSAKTSGNIIERLEDNTKVTIKSVVFESKTSTASGKKWYNVSVTGKDDKTTTGYINAKYVDGVKYTTVDAKTTDKVTYRKGAGTKMKNAGTLKKGKKVKVYLKATPASGTAGSSKTWYMIKVGDKKYYACSKYFKLIEDTPDPIPTPVVDPDPAPADNTDPVVDENAPKFNSSSVNKPPALTVGQSYGISGTITCDKKMNRVQVGIQDADGDWIGHPYSKIPDKGISKFNVADADSSVKFGIIAPGKYKYIINCYVNDVKYEVVKHSFTVVALSSSLTQNTIDSRLAELKTALTNKYFTSDKKACGDSVGDTCNVDKVVGYGSKNDIVKTLLLTNKGGEHLDTALLPLHYGVSGETYTRGWSCCGFGGFAGWYIGADTITDDVNNVIVKMGCDYNKTNMKKYARPGDIIRADNSHTFVILSVDDSGCTVLDSNWNHDCKVQVHSISYSRYTLCTISRCSRCA